MSKHKILQSNSDHISNWSICIEWKPFAKINAVFRLASVRNLKMEKLIKINFLAYHIGYVSLSTSVSVESVIK